MSTSTIIDAFRSVEEMGVRESDVQRAYATRIGEIIDCAQLNGHGQGLVEAETGVGKTLGYLIPSLLSAATTGKRAVISTYTMHLQQQIMAPGGDMERAIVAVERVTGTRLTAARRVGRRNFIDVDRVSDRYLIAIGDASLSSEERAEWDAFASWAKETETGEISEFFEAEGVDVLPCGLAADDICLTPLSSDSAKARYNEHVAASKLADVLVTNHAMLVRAAMSGVSLLHSEGDDRGIGVLLVDECDRLPDVARDATSDLLPLREMEQALQRWNERREDNVAGPLIRAVAAVRERLSDACPYGGSATGKENFTLWEDVDSSERQEIIKDMKLVAGTSKGVKQAINGTAKTANDIDLVAMIADYIRVANNVVDCLANGSDEGLVAIRWSPKRQYPSFRLFSLRPARILKRLWSPWQGQDEASADTEERSAPVKADALILTSATLSAPSKSGRPNFSEIKIELGIYDPQNACAHLHGGFSPDVFGRADFVVPDPSAPYPFLKANSDNVDEDVIRELNPDWIDYAASMVEAASKEGGRVLVLTNSYRATASISEKLREKGVVPVEKTRQRRAQECIREVIADARAVFVSPSAWEGLDLKSYGVHNAFRHVVIAQLPYRTPDGAREMAIKRHLLKKGCSISDAQKVLYFDIRATALRRFKQGLGRGIRDRKDIMTLWVADPRFPAPKMFNEDMSGRIPPRRVPAHQEFAWAIPKRFRDGAFGSAFEDDAKMFLTSGELVGAEEMV